MGYKSKKAAKEAGQKARGLLDSPHGWEVLVQNNQGWHVFLYKLGMTLSLDLVSGEFNVYMSDSNQLGVGVERWYVPESFKDPNKAIKAQLNLLRQEVVDTADLLSLHLTTRRCVGIKQLMIQIFGSKGPQRRFCEETNIPQSTVTSWNGINKLSSTVSFLLRLMVAADELGYLPALLKRTRSIRVQ